MDDKRQLLRHTVATLAYRATRALEDAPETSPPSTVADANPSRFSPTWAISSTGRSVRCRETNAGTTPLPFRGRGKQRFFAALKAFDDYLASDEPLHADAEPLFQGPIADALTHVGQIAMLRRLAGVLLAAKISSSPLSPPDKSAQNSLPPCSHFR